MYTYNICMSRIINYEDQAYQGTHICDFEVLFFSSACKTKHADIKVPFNGSMNMDLKGWWIKQFF